MRYQLDIQVGGNAEKALDSLHKKLGGIAEIAEKVGQSGFEKSFEKGGAVAMDMNQQFRAMADQLEQTLTAVYTKVRSLFEKVVTDAATFEDLTSDMQFAFGDGWEVAMAKAKTEAAKLTFSMEDVVKTVSALKRQKIDIFGPDMNNITTFKAKTGSLITGLEVIQDAADAAGRNAQQMLFSFREAFSGDWKSLKDALDLPKKVTDEWNKAMQKGKDQSAKANILLGKVAEMFGGAGKLREANFNKTIQQIPDLLQQIAAGAGKDGLKHVTMGIKDIVTALQNIVNSKGAMMLLSSFFNVIGFAAGAIIRAAAGFIEFGRAVAEMFPFVGPLAGALFVLLTVITALAFVGFTAAAGITALLAAMSSGAFLVFIKVLLVALPAVILMATVLGAALGALILVGVAGAQILSNNWGGVANVFDNVKLVVTALKELFDTYNGSVGAMSKETADKLKKAGLFDFVREVFMGFHRLNVAFRSFKAEMSMFGQKVAPVFIPLMGELKLLIYEIADALGISNTATGIAQTSTKSWADVAKDLVNALAAVTRGIVNVIRVGVFIVRMALAYKVFHVVLIGIGVVLAVIAAALTVVAVVGGTLMFVLVAPFVAMGAAIYAAIRGLSILKAMMPKEAGGDGLSFDEAVERTSAKTPGFLQEVGNRWGESQNPMIKAHDEDSSSWKAGDMHNYRRLSEDEARAMNRGYDVGGGAAGGTDYDKQYSRDTDTRQFGPPPPPGAGGDAAAAATKGNEQVAAAVAAQTAALGGIQGALQNMNISVNIDGKEVAKAVAAQQAKFGGLEDGQRETQVRLHGNRRACVRLHPGMAQGTHRGPQGGREDLAEAQAPHR